MQKIVPYLWFDNQAEDAINFYTSTFNNAKITSVMRHPEGGPGPAGTVMSVEFQLEGHEFVAFNAGPQFSFTPAISFFVHCDTPEEVDRLWGKLSEGGSVLVPLDKYPFSDKFGWCADKYGITWQVNLGSSAQKITPFLMFVREHHGQAEEAINLYTSIFNNAKIATIQHHGSGGMEPEGTVMHARFYLEGQEFMAMDSNMAHDFTFTEAISLFVKCQTQQEVDKFWDALTEGGEEQPCGWLKDKYGVSWQIVPTVLGELLADKDPEKAGRVMQALFQMKKIDIETLQRAYAGQTASHSS